MLLSEPFRRWLWKAVTQVRKSGPYHEEQAGRGEKDNE